MPDAAATARLMRVIDAMTRELDRKGLAEAMVNLGFDPTALAEVVIKAADCAVIQFPGGRRFIEIQRGALAAIASPA